ncbi:MAG: hypothetical protein A2Y38_19770 [Spirochaetes bacterium GWB1_59_5]|nr:MAG: hypothetical protein A2Y38_19770 [Spirochaetes bacterium GWB1_59_5]
MDAQTWLDITTLTATHCCVCRAHLTDAISINRGLGPICSHHFYKVEHEITADMVEVALGVVFASGLDPQVKSTAKHLKDRPRDFCNILVKWASAHYDDRAVVFDVADAIAAFGFVELAAKLREDRTKVHLRVDATDPTGGRLTIHTGRSHNFDRYIRRIPGVTQAPKEGRYEGWSFPKEHENAVLIMAGFGFPNEWATLVNKTGRLKARGWYDVQAVMDALYPPPPRKPLFQPAPAPVQLPLPAPVVPPSIVQVTPDGKTLEIRTPKWNGNWLQAFKTLVPWKLRAWTGSMWTCPATFKAEVEKLVTLHFQTQP